MARISDLTRNARIFALAFLLLVFCLGSYYSRPLHDEKASTEVG
jgi:hypothetical protein